MSEQSGTKILVDVKRTCKVIVIQQYPEDHWIEPGSCYYMENAPKAFWFACPGCGAFGSIPVGKNKPEHGWKIEKGEVFNPATLTLSPSINCVGCCGWHGYLKEGVFEPC